MFEPPMPLSGRDLAGVFKTLAYPRPETVPGLVAVGGASSRSSVHVQLAAEEPSRRVRQEDPCDRAPAPRRAHHIYDMQLARGDLLSQGTSCGGRCHKARYLS